jgi:hypothetical protein
VSGTIMARAKRGGASAVTSVDKHPRQSRRPGCGGFGWVRRSELIGLMVGRVRLSVRGMLGWLRLLGFARERKRTKEKGASGSGRESWPMADIGNGILYNFQNIFPNCKLIRIQFKFEI